MQPIEISSYEDFKAYEGQELGVSDWHTIDQKASEHVCGCYS